MEAFAKRSALPPGEMERRKALRVGLPFPAIVRGTDTGGVHFTADAVLDNLSACGLYTHLDFPVEVGSRLFVIVHLTMERHVESAPSVALYGHVVRVEPQPDGTYGVALEFYRHRFLYTAEADISAMSA